MLKISITSFGSDLCKLSINEQFVKYIKKKDIPVLAEDINNWVMEQRESIADSLEIKISPDHEFNIDSLSPQLERELSELLTTGHNKKAIILSDELGVSGKDGKTPVLFTYRNLDAFKHYWKKYCREATFSLYEVLSEDIIETPYVDDPRDSLFFFDKIAYHSNHGTTHSIRQAELARQYLQLVKTYGTSAFRPSAQSMNNEEFACLQLAAFLFRSGRTNELGWEGDLTYGKRSAAIFKQIALELKFNSNLVNLVATCFDYHAQPNITSSLPNQNLEQTRIKINLFTKLLKLSHESDLVRCFENYEEIKKPIAGELSCLLEPSNDANTIADSFLAYAANLCRITGASITCRALHSNEKDSIKDNVKVATKAANAPKSTLYSLIGIIPETLPQFVSPTYLWFQSEEHIHTIDSSQTIPTLQLELEGEESKSFVLWGHDAEGHQTEVTCAWTKEDFESVPTAQCITLEKQYIQTHVSVYHATTKSSYALDLLSRNLKVFMDGANYITWIRDFHSKPPGTAYKNIQEIIEKMLQKNEVDNSNNNSWHLLSCSPTLWHNVDYATEESTVNYYYNNSSVSQLNFKKIIFTLFDEMGLLVGEDDLRQTLFDEFIQNITSEVYGKEGVIYQYIIPHHLVDEVAYISGQNGSIDTQNPSALETLIRLKSPNTTTPNQNILQVRLFVPKLLEPEIAEQIHVYNHLNMDVDLKALFEKSISKFAKEAYNGPSSAVKLQSKAEAPVSEKASYQFQILSSLRKEYDLTHYVRPKKKQDVEADSDSILFSTEDMIGNYKYM